MPRTQRTGWSVLTLLMTVGLLVAFLPACSPAHAKKKTDTAGDKKPEEKKDEDSPFKDWDKTLKDVETQKGLITVHRKHDNTWFELDPDQLDKPLLMVSSVSSGLGKGWILGGMPLDTDIWYFHRAGNKIQVKVKNARFRADEKTPMSDAVALSYADSVLQTAKIVSINKDSKHLLIDVNDILAADLPALGLALKQFIGPAGLDKERTSIGRIKSFPKNLEIEIAAVYNAGEARPLDTVSDPRYIPVGIHYSISELPEDGYKARLADDRVGYFLTAVKDFSRDSSDSFFVRYVNRWKLEKQDPNAAISPPKEPIVYYLDKTIPQEYRQYVREGILMWNKAFEKAGFRDAMVVKDAPDDPDFDPEDVRYNTIRWITSSEPSFGAIGPSRVDPRNGHILDADILVEAAMVQNARRGYRNYINTRISAAASPYSGAPETHQPPDFSSFFPQGPASICSIGEGAELGAAVDAAFFQTTGEMEPGGTVPEEYIGHFLHWVVSHEVGHTLGLRHNFRASAATPNNKLQDVSWTREHGLYDSVMEYPAPNISLDRNNQGDYYTQSVGDYDVWAIQYAYTPMDGKTPDDELPALKKIAEQSTKPGHEYGTDDDAFAGPIPIGIDPDTNQFDLGADPLAYGKQRLELIHNVRGKIQKNLTAPGEGYDRLRNSFDSLVAAQSQVLHVVAKQVGGIRTSRAHRGDPGERPAFVPVPAARQREAMGILSTSAFSDEAWEVSPELLNSLQPNHFWHWGTDTSNAVPVDYSYEDRVLGIQEILLDRLLHPILLTRVLETEGKYGKGEPYTLAEHVRSLTDSVFSEIGPKAPAGKLAISPIRRNLGRAMLDRLIVMTNSPPYGLPADARSLARTNLLSVDKRMAATLAGRGAGMDETTKAYLEESRSRIKRALDAQSVVLGV